MNNRHIVDTAVFDIGFCSEQTAFELQTELHAFINKELLTVVEEVFEKNSPANAVIRIASLEIDLGHVPVSRYQDELPQRLRQELMQQLAEIRQSIRDKSASNNSLIEVKTASCELVEYFLLHGHLPWYASLKAGQGIEDLLNKMIVTEPQRLKAFLKNTRQNDIITERLVSQFDAETVSRLLRLLSPGHASQIDQLVAALTREWQGLQPLFGPQLGGVEAMSRQLWSGLIKLVLEKGSRQLSAEEMLAMVLQALFVQVPQSNTAMVESLARQFEMSAAPDTAVVGIILRGLVAEFPGQAAVTDVTNTLATPETRQDRQHGTDKTESENQQLRQSVIDSLGRGDISNIKASWPVLVKQQAGMLEQLLRHYGRQAVVREKIVQGFSEAMLHDILEIIEPREYGFVATVLAQPALFLTQHPSPSQSNRRAHEQMWLFTLGYLLVERGSRFNKKSYIGSLLRQMAISTGEDYRTLLTGLSENIATLPASNGLARQLSEFLAELRHEIRPDAKSDARQQGDQEHNEQHAYELYETIAGVLLRGAGKGRADVDLIEAVQGLKSKAPWLFLRLLKEMQLSEFAQPLSAPNIPVALLRQLALAILVLPNTAEGSAPTDLIKAIDSYAKRATNSTLYFSKVIFCLLNGQLLDFDAIIEESNSFAQPDSPIPSVPVVSDSHPQRDSRLSVSEHLVSQFLAGNNQQGSDDAALLFAFEQLVSQRPAWLRQLLLSSFKQQQTLAQLTQHLPESMLAQCLALTGVAGGYSLQRCAEIITTACYIKEFGVVPARLRLFKWQAIFSYIADRGRLYNEQDFAQYFLTRLCEVAKPADSDKLVTAVSRQLAVNSLPATTALSQRIIGWINDLQPGVANVKEAPVNRSAANDVVSEDQQQPVEDIYIANAGLVLAASYLPRLFEMLGLVEQSAFKDRDAAVRGVHMLQFLVNGSSSTPEYQLVLNKLLCGVRTGIPIAREISLSEAEASQLEGLLLGMIQNWKSLGKTSIVGLRESFLQRQGRLQLRDDAWHLLVEPKPFDMLLDQIPWGYTTIKYPWMEKVIYVEWR